MLICLLKSHPKFSSFEKLLLGIYKFSKQREALVGIWFSYKLFNNQQCGPGLQNERNRNQQMKRIGTDVVRCRILAFPPMNTAS